MPSLQVEQPPAGTEQKLVEYLYRMFTNIDIALSQSNLYIPIYVLPNKPEIGRIYYFGDVVLASPIIEEGWWGFKSTGWVQLA